eukprot:Skav214942  [mRNA]  locus=scaffold2244:64594:65040:- [translate_table: standard]
MGIEPVGFLREGHQDALNATYTAAQHFQAKNGASVIDKVELHITAATEKLPLLLLFCEVLVSVLFKDWHVCFGNCVQSFFGKLQVCLWILGVEIIEKNASQASCLTTVFDQEVFICPLLELWIPIRVVLVAHVLVGTMKVLHVIVIEV